MDGELSRVYSTCAAVVEVLYQSIASVLRHWPLLVSLHSSAWLHSPPSQSLVVNAASAAEDCESRHLERSDFK